jgi:hypothetical protein
MYCHVSGVPWRIIAVSGLNDWTNWHFYYNHSSSQLIITANSQWLSRIRAIPYWTTNVLSSTVTGLVLIHFFSFRCPLVNTPQLITQFSYEWNLVHDWRLQYEWMDLVRMLTAVRMTNPLWMYIWLTNELPFITRGEPMRCHPNQQFVY